MDGMTDQELADLKRKAMQDRRRWGSLDRVLGRSDLDAGYWIPALVTEVQRARPRCAKLEQDCAQLQREYDALRYGPASPAT